MVPKTVASIMCLVNIKFAPIILNAKTLASSMTNKGFQEFGSDLGRSRTLNLLIRSQTLYPIELQGHCVIQHESVSVTGLQI